MKTTWTCERDAGNVHPSRLLAGEQDRHHRKGTEMGTEAHDACNLLAMQCIARVWLHSAEHGTPLGARPSDHAVLMLVRSSLSLD